MSYEDGRDHVRSGGRSSDFVPLTQAWSGARVQEDHYDSQRASSGGSRSSFGSDGSSGGTTAGDIEVKWVGNALVVGGVFFGLYWLTDAAFPNELTAGVAGAVLTGAAATTEWVRRSRALKIAAPVVTALVSAGGVYAAHALSPEGDIPRFVGEHSGALFDATAAVGVALYPRSVRNLIREHWKKAAAVSLLLTATAGVVGGVYDNLYRHQINPLNFAARADAFTSDVSSEIFEWSTADFKKSAPTRVVAHVLNAGRIVVSIPYEIAAVAGGAIGNGGPSVVEFVWEEAVVPAYRYVAGLSRDDRPGPTS